MELFGLAILLSANIIRLAESGSWPDDILRNSTPNVLCELGCICPDEGQTIFLDCTGRSITELPSMIAFPPETKVVTFQKNFIRNISESTFFDTMRIEELDLSFNKLIQIDDYAFRPFRSLTLLRLSTNELFDLSPKTLYGLSKLRILELGHNNLRVVPEGFFVHTTVLQELRIQFNKLHSLTNNAFQFLTHLEKLDLKGNKLMTLPHDLFQRTPRLQTLSLAENEFRRVPKEALAQASLLHSLDLNSNHFEILSSGSFSTLRNVSLLYLNYLHQLSRVEKNAFENMTGLKTLSCSYNEKLNYFHPEAFGVNRPNRTAIYYPKEQLLLRHNGLRSLPEPQKIDSWSKLSHVDLRDNPWRCDCKIRWMRKLKLNIMENVRCESPFSVHGRTIVSLTEEEMVCSSQWMFSTVVLVSTSVIAFIVCISMVTLVVCYSTPLGRAIKTRSQFSYRKFAPRKEDMVDLDWDPAGVM